MPKYKRTSQREVSVADMKGGSFHINKYDGICQVKCCNNPLGATCLPLMCWTVWINTICLFIAWAGNQCKYRERQWVHFTALFSLHSHYPRAKSWWCVQSNGRGGKEPQEQAEAWSQPNWGEEERRKGSERVVEKLWELEGRLIFGRINRQWGVVAMAVFKGDGSKSERGVILVEMW